MSALPESFVRQLVRGYSSELKQKNTENYQNRNTKQMLENAFTKSVDDQDELAALILKATSLPAAAAALQKQFAALKATVEEFNKAFPEINQKNGSKKSTSWASLHDTIRRLKEQNDVKSGKGFLGKTKKKFHGICGTINDHLTILKILPQGEYYTAPICGAVELIVKASVNHENVGEEFGAALKEIDDIVCSVRKELTLSQDVTLLGWTIELCCKVIDFLGFPLRWYTQSHWKRTLASFNESLSKNYQVPIGEIRRLSELVRRGVGIRTAIQVDNIHESMSAIADFVLEARKHHQSSFAWTEHLPTMYQEASAMHIRSLREHSDEHFKAMQQSLTSIIKNEIGNASKQIIDWNAQQWGMMYMQQLNVDSAEPRAFLDRSMVSQQVSLVQPLRTRAEVYAVARLWSEYYELNQIVLDFPNANNFLEGRVAERLQEWTVQTSSSILAVFGPATSAYEDATRLLTANYIQAARRAAIPCVSYFCNVSHEEPPSNRTRETVGLAQLAYALLHQLLAYLPAQLPSSPIVSQDMFNDLNGTLIAWDTILHILKTLVAVTESPYLLFAIHGLELVEDVYTKPRLESLLRTIREISSGQTATGPKVKVLLTTSGLSQVLSSGLDEDQICDISGGNAARRPGRSGKGRRRFGDLRLEDN
ncbi:hypothetical protein DE146DRAFT_643332 [Phaeosphaeria sp. MPI-PUGE-AT-0046c]|nr:hypothetical protein DE146DRAFT_643332 [Phaeosphaeria sp. MPI-PUGE-AT-0046c]